MKYKETFRINFKLQKKIKETLKSDANMIFKFVIFFATSFSKQWANLQ